MSQPDARDGGDDADSLEQALKELRISYEKYFAGVEHREPQKARDDFKKRLRRVMGEHIKNTARRFRLQSIQASLVTLEQHWNRITRQIEEGTFKRDRVRADKLRRDEPAAERAEAPSPDAKPDASPKAQRQYPEPVRALHQAFVEARKKTGEHNPVPIESFVQTLQKQYTVIKAKYQCENVEFKVAEKDGKVILKAIPK